MRLALFGPCNGPTGYDEVTRSFLTELFVRGHWVTIEPHVKWTADVVEHGHEKIVQLCQNANYPVDVDFQLNICLPDQAKQSPHSTNACYTMFEASKVPPMWVESSRGQDLIVVPTEWNRDMFIDSGMDANKVRVCPLGVSPSIYHPDVPKLAIVTDRGKSFSDFTHKFLCVQELVSRKNVPALIKAWLRAVRPEDNACLLLKLGSHSGDKLGRFRQRIMEGLSEAERQLLSDTVLFYSRILADKYMAPLFSACTHYITMTCGEGWGLPENKAGMMGKYLVAPDHSGLSAYVSDDTAYVLPWKEEPAMQEGPTRRLYEGANWYRPDDDAAVAMIRQSIDDAAAGDRSRPDALRKCMLSQYTTGRSVETLLATLKDYQHLGIGGQVPYKVGERFTNFLMHVQTLGTPCGIANYSHTLFMHMLREHQFVRKNGSGILAGKEPYALIDLVDNNSIDVVHVQLEYQFMTEQRLRLLFRQLRARGVKSVVTMHTVHTRASGLNHVILQEADQIVVSSGRMAGVLDEVGSLDNVHVIPMGCDPAAAKTSTAPPYDGRRPFVLGFYGFTYFHKGIDAILLGLKTLNRLFGEHAVQARIFSVKPAQDNVGYFDRCTALVETLQLTDDVFWDSRYQEERAIIERLSGTDLIVLPYSEYGGVGISAAGRAVMQAGVPLMLTRNSFFADITDFPDLAMAVQTPQDVPGALTAYVKSIKANPMVHQEQLRVFTAARDRFFAINSWSECAKAHLDLYDGLCRRP